MTDKAGRRVIAFTFTVFGEGQAKGSSKGFVLQKPGARPRAIITSTNRNLKAWEALVRSRANEARTAAGRQQPLAGPVALAIDFYFARPKRLLTRRAGALYQPHVTAPDLSKLVRGLEDALSGVLFLDDKQVAAIAATKAYAPPGDGPSCRITVCEHYPA